MNNGFLTHVKVGLKALLVSAALYASLSHAGQDNIRFETIGLEQGLSQQNVRDIHQDSEGFMWFATQEGLNRFDGYQFKVYSNSLNNPDSIGSSFVNSIAESSDGLLWIGTGSGVSVFDKNTQKFKRYRYLQGNSGQQVSEVKVILIDSMDNIWVGTADGVNLYNPLTDTFELVKIGGTPNGKPVLVDSIVEDITNGIWIGANNHGLYRIDNLTGEVTLITEKLSETHNIRDSGITKLMIDSEQRLWVGTTTKGIFMLDLKMQMTDSLSFATIDQLEDIEVRAVYEDENHNIWVGSRSGLYLLERGTKTVRVFKYDVNNRQSIADNTVSSLFQDRGGVLWVGTYRGLSKWNTATANFDYYRYHSDKSTSLSHPNINVIHNAGNDQVWIGTNNGLNLLDLTTDKIEQIFTPEDGKGLLSNNILSMFAANKEELWIGHLQSGLSYLDRKTNEYKHFVSDPDDPETLGANGVTSIIGGANDEIWVGTYNGGLHRFNRETQKFRRYQHNVNNDFSISSNKVLSLYRDSTDMLWVGTWDAGVNLFNAALGTSQRIQHDEDNNKSLGSNKIWAVHEDKNRNIWIGTSGSGLNFLSYKNRAAGNYEFERYSREHGLPSSNVFSILEDNNGMLWLSTNRGLTKFDPASKNILNYDTTHGLQGNEFNSGAYYKMPDGKFFFGGTNGLTAFFPEDISPNKHVPPVVLTRFQRLNEVSSMNSAQKASNKIEVSHKDYLIAFEFAGLDFASPDNNRYAYKLEGFDADWIEARDVRKATYTNLPAGNYVFKVKASNNDGVWNERGADILLTVLPAPWFSWWAYSIYTFIFLATTFWLYRSYLNKVKQEEIYRLQLENEVQKRTMELSAANEQLMNASVTDQLTGLNNRRYLANVIKDECKNISQEFNAYMAEHDAEANEGPRLFFLMFDLDGFKPINDTYGHDAGDRVIVQVGELLQSVCRDDDIVIRWGGDEFMVIGKVHDQGEVSFLAERIRETIEKYGFNIGLSQRMHLSSSIGYAMYPFAHFSPDSLSWEQVHLLADKALYKSKDNGRNTWVGMVQCPEVPPVGVMNTLTHNVDKAVELGHIILETPDTMRAMHQSRNNVSTLADRK